jgi:hypothetical protein
MLRIVRVAGEDLFVTEGQYNFLKTVMVGAWVNTVSTETVRQFGLTPITWHQLHRAIAVAQVQYDTLTDEVDQIEKWSSIPRSETRRIDTLRVTFTDCKSVSNKRN